MRRNAAEFGLTPTCSGNRWDVNKGLRALADKLQRSSKADCAAVPGRPPPRLL